MIASQPLEAGVPRHVVDVVRTLDRTRFRVDVACPRESTLWRELEADEGVTLHAIAAARRPSPADAASLGRLLPLVRRADVVHAHSSKAGFLARAAALATGRTRRCVFTPHGWSFWAAEGAEQRLYLELERVAARWCRTIVAVGDAERDSGLAARVGRAEQYRVVRNGIDVDRFAADPQPVAGRILMVGRLAPPKRQDLAVRAVARVRAAVPEAELWLVGDGPGRDELERTVAEVGAGSFVRLLGNREDVPRLLAEAACVVLASDYEGTPLSVLEAMAAGVPVVASHVGGVGEAVLDGETGLLVPPDDEDALAAAIAEALGSPDRARALGEAGRARARAGFSLRRMVGELADLYEEVAAGGRRVR